MKSNNSVVIDINFLNNTEIECLYYDEAAPSLDNNPSCIWDSIEKGQLFEVSILKKTKSEQKTSIKQCMSNWFCCRKYTNLNCK